MLFIENIIILTHRLGGIVIIIRFRSGLREETVTARTENEKI